MTLLLQRHAADGECLPGDFFVDGQRYSFSMERTSRAFPAGRYEIDFTESARVHDGKLWSPDPEQRLPVLVNVPGRSGVRIHAANDPEELDGCTALGMTFANKRLGSSRAAVGPFVATVRAMKARGEQIWIDVKDHVADVQK